MNLFFAFFHSSIKSMKIGYLSVTLVVKGIKWVCYGLKKTEEASREST